MPFPGLPRTCVRLGLLLEVIFRTFTTPWSKTLPDWYSFDLLCQAPSRVPTAHRQLHLGGRWEFSERPLTDSKLGAEDLLAET